MHQQIAKYIYEQRERGRIGGRIIEVGSLDVNGNLNDAIGLEVTRTDMRKGPNVDVVCPAQDLLERFGAESFDTVISSDAFEHMEDWRACLKSMWGILKMDGWLVMTMAAPEKGRHNHPNDYWRADWEHILRIWPEAEDLQQWGPSMGWSVQKHGDLPDLSVINLKKVA